MTSAQTPGTAASPTKPNNLRSVLDNNRAQGKRVSVADTVKLIVPLCVEVADLHRQGYGVFLHPSNVVPKPEGYELSSELAATPPTQPPDLACMPPEFTPNELGDARASVYSIGAMMYELVTGAPVSPNMKRPTELVPGIPHEFEVLLANALIADADHRPDDLNALAQAVYHLVPPDTMLAPPAADEQRVSMLAIDVDVSLSMMPPESIGAPAPVPTAAQIPALGAATLPRGLGPTTALPPERAAHPGHPNPAPRANASPDSGALGGGAGAVPGARAIKNHGNQAFNVGVADARQIPSGDAATAELAQLRSELEADGTPRYVVIKDGMDHGPFSGVELLQQLGSHSFSAEDEVLDQKTNQQKPIADWPQFCQFAEHAKRHRDIAQEREAIVRGVAQEGKRTRGKAMLGLLVLGVLAVAAGVWFVTQVGTRSDEVAIHTESVSNIEAEGDVRGKKGSKSKGGQRRRVVGSQGGIPILAGGMSCEQARATYVEEISMKGGGQADITRGQYASIMNSGSYFSHCGVPFSVAVSICAAVQNGRAVGVTVSTTPRHSSRSCIASAVRRLKFPSHPKLDVVRVNFAAQ